MRLSDYLEMNSITASSFARKANTYPQTIHKYLKGQRIPCSKMMGVIVRITNGDVQPNDFFNLGTDTIMAENTDSPQQNHVEQGAQHAGK